MPTKRLKVELSICEEGKDRWDAAFYFSAENNKDKRIGVFGGGDFMCEVTGPSFSNSDLAERAARIIAEDYGWDIVKVKKEGME